MNTQAIRESMTRTQADQAALIEEMQNVYQTARAINSSTADCVTTTQWWMDRLEQVSAYEASLNASRANLATAASANTSNNEPQ